MASRLDPIDASDIQQAFGRDDLKTYTDPESFQKFLYDLELDNVVLLLMSSGNYGGMDWDALATRFS